MSTRIPYWEKPLAMAGLTSYRYKGNYGWIMIGATDNADALKEVKRSISYGEVDPSKLQIWNGSKYVSLQDELGEDI